MRFVCVLACLLLSYAATGQAQDASAHDHDVPAAPSDRPTVSVRGFTDINFSQTDDEHSPDGFALGQFAGQLSASLGAKVHFFGETSVTARSTAFTVEVERAILRYDYNDHFKLSVGRYHTPINYWNTAFHHGLWLQTTASRPDMIQTGGTFQPVHFVGLLAEGTVGSPSLGLGYNAGVGNGRGSAISRAGDAGDVNRNRAWLLKLFARPSSLYGVELGGAAYHDVIAIAGTDGYPELITSAYAALTSETPEVIAEFTNVRHHDRATGVDFNSQAFYVQAAVRLPVAPALKPYARYEKMLGEPAEPVFGNVSGATATFGLRCELAESAALKGEYRHIRRPGGLVVNGVYLQTALTF